MPFQIPFVTKSVLLGGSNYQENKIVGKKRQKKICQRQIERLEQSHWHSNFSLSIVKLSNTF